MGTFGRRATGRQACPQPNGLRVLIAVLVAVLAAVGCTSTAGEPGTNDRESGRGRSAGDCGPLRFAQVGGRVPAYLDRELDAFPNDHALCAGLWLPPTGSDFVPQGLAVDGTEALVSGYDDGPMGSRYCRVLRVDLRNGRQLDEMSPVAGSIAGRDPVTCRHGGGLLLDEHGLWLVESTRLWLLDPDTLETERAWGLTAPVRGSFAVSDGAHRLGLGGFRRAGRDRLFWFEPADLLAGSVADLTESAASGVQPVPAWAQGALWGDLGPGPAGVWFAMSHTSCGVLVGPRGTKRGFLPGAEGIDLAGRRILWAVSESAARSYQLDGDRPVVPMLARFDVADLNRWSRPDCQP